MLNAIPGLEAEEDLRALVIAGVGANPGEKGAAFKKLSNELRNQATATQTRPAVDTVAPGLTPGVDALADGDALLQELRAKRSAWAAERGRQL